MDKAVKAMSNDVYALQDITSTSEGGQVTSPQPTFSINSSQNSDIQAIEPNDDEISINYDDSKENPPIETSKSDLHILFVAMIKAFSDYNND